MDRGAVSQMQLPLWQRAWSGRARAAPEAAGPALVSIWGVVTRVCMCPSVCTRHMYALHGVDVSWVFCVF